MSDIQRKNSTRYNFADVRLLLVDNCSFFRQLMKSVLEEIGFRQVRLAASAEEAIDTLQTYHADLILCELEMEPTDGMAFVKAIRREKASYDPAVPIIMISGRADHRSVLAARDIGITEFLAKPVAPKTLFHRIVMTIDRPRAFVKAPNYVGPCRRRFVHYEYDGVERRGAQPESSQRQPSGQPQGHGPDARPAGVAQSRRR